MTQPKTYPRAIVFRLPSGSWAINLNPTPGTRKLRQIPTFVSAGHAGTAAAKLVTEARTALADKAGSPAAPARKRGGSKPRGPRVRPCPGCDRDTRPQQCKSDEYPGTVVRVDKEGRCATCHNKPGKHTRAADAPSRIPLGGTAAPAPAESSPEAPASTATTTSPVAGHEPTLTPAGAWACSCGWDPYYQADTYIETSGQAAAAVRTHIRSHA